MTIYKNVLDMVGHAAMLEVRSLDTGKCRVFLKLEMMNPGGSIKDRIALAIVDDAERRGVLQPGMTLIEATAGNTGVGLALVAAARGYRLVCVMPEKMSADKRTSLRAMGARVIITPNASPSSPENFQNVARRLAEENGWFLTDQFENPANILAHEEGTANELIGQVSTTIGAFVAGAGTGGTITGVGRRLKAVDPRTRVLLADPVGSGLAQWVETGVLGPDGPYEVEGIGASKVPGNLHRDVIDGAEPVTDDESFAMVRRLVLEEGLFVGGSSGTNLVAALRVAAGGELHGPVVTVMCDSWDRYRAKPWMQEWEEA